MTAARRLALSLAGCLALGAALFVAAERWWLAPEPEQAPPEAPLDGRQTRAEELRAAIEAQREALREARAQRGEASAELERLDEELSAIRRELDGLRDYLERNEEPER